MPLLALLFLITAALYAAVGFGGGSTYNALLVLAEVDYRLVPSVALVCNLIVVSGGVLRFARAGHFDWGFAWPFFVLSVPMAWLGGSIQISQQTFMLVLGCSLLFAGTSMLFGRVEQANTRPDGKRRLAIGLTCGGAIGLLGGLVGIGGGIFLSPLLHRLRLAQPKVIASTASLFILVNSAAGLVGQTLKLGTLEHARDMAGFIPLFLAVFVGGQIGSRLGAGRFSQRGVRALTAVLVLYVGARLLYSWWVFA